MITNKPFVGMLAGLLLLSAGCSSSVEPVVAAEAEEIMETGSEEKIVSIEKSNNEAAEDKGDSQVGKQNSQLVGKIVTVHGNFVQIDKVDLPERTLERMNKQGRQNGSEVAQTEGQGQTNLAAAMTGSAGAKAGGGAPRMAGNGQRGGSLTDMEFSGDIVDVMIPVGASINQSSDPSLDLNYDNLKKGMVIRIKVDLEMTEEFNTASETETFYADTVLVME